MKAQAQRTVRPNGHPSRRRVDVPVDTLVVVRGELLRTRVNTLVDAPVNVLEEVRLDVLVDIRVVSYSRRRPTVSDFLVDYPVEESVLN